MPVGRGLLVAGVVLLRRATSAGVRWLRAIMLVLGSCVFYPLAPGTMGSFTAGRLGISGWMLLFAVFRYGLTRLTGIDEEAY